MTEWAELGQLNQLQADLKLAGGKAAVRAALVVKKTAHDIEATAKQFAPVDTGNLRASISTDIHSDALHATVEAEIGPTAEYGAYVEFGTSRMAPRAYMGPALDRHSGAFELAMGQITQGLL